MPNLLKEIKQNKLISEADFKLIEKAYEFACMSHDGQKRYSGEPYFNHLIETARILNNFKLDAQTISAGLLHDVIDECGIKGSDLEKLFGKKIRFFVESISNLGTIHYRGLEGKVENLRKMFLSMAKDIRVIMIKMASRLHNMRTFKFLPEERKKAVALETLKIYAPLASRLGIGSLKGEFEDLVFPYLYPKEYNWLIQRIPFQYEERLKYLVKVKSIFENQLKKEKINFIEINTRAKHHYSLYQKLLKNNMDFNEIYDLVALRVIVEDIPHCYKVLGVVHNLWKPLLGRIKDYIALPKPNGYQSIHTTVFCLAGKIVEIQIKTEKMHQEAEYGIAAHWAYSELNKPESGVRFDVHRFSWVKQLSQWLTNISKNPDFLESLRINFFEDRIFVFTPRGDVIDLPKDSTPIDFAYRIHSDIGDHAVGVKINNKMVKLSDKLKNGDVVAILTTKNKKPSADWLNFVKTYQARGRIKHVLGL